MTGIRHPQVRDQQRSHDSATPPIADSRSRHVRLRRKRNEDGGVPPNGTVIAVP